MRRAGTAVVAALLVTTAACSPESRPEPGPVSFDWREAALMSPEGRSGAPVVRDAVACGDDLFVVGAVRDDKGGTFPAAWRSSGDATSWTSIRVDAQSFYGRQNVLFTVACRDGRMAAVGAKPGGAHGNPRVSSWSLDGAGVLREVSAASFELYGGPKAVNVSRLAAGAAGFLIAGNRASGAAVWSSRDASRFEILEGAPGLASDPAGITWAADAVAVGDRWLVVGGVLPAGRVDRDAVGWSGAAGGAWRRVGAADPTADFEELHRVALVGDVPTALGVRGSVFGVWRLESDQWRPAASFGSVRPSAWSGVRGMAVSGSRVIAATGDGAAFGLWVSDDQGARWRSAVLPRAVAAGAGSSLTVAAGSGLLVLLPDDGVTGRVYTAVTSA